MAGVLMLSRNQRIVFFAITHLSVALIFGLMFFEPLMQKYIQMYEKVKKVNKDREIVTGTVNSIPQMIEENKKLQDEFDAYNRRLPVDDKVSMIISQISEKTSGIDVKILSINSADSIDIKDKSINAKPIIIDLITDLKTLAEYLSLIETIDTALAIKKVFINKRDDVVVPKLSVNIHVETYIAKVNKQ